MESKTERSARLEKLFANNPKVDKFFLTSDDQAFLKEDRAVAHGRSLEDKAVECFERDAPEASGPEANALEVVITDQILADNPELGEEGVEVGDIATVSAESDLDGLANISAEALAAMPNTVKYLVDQGVNVMNLNTQPKVDPAADEKAALQAKYKELFGKAPNHMTGVPKLQAAIAEKEAELAK